MIVQGRYIGRTEWDYQGINIIHNKVYPIEICPNEYGYNYVVKIYFPTLLDKIIGKDRGSDLMTNEYYVIIDLYNLTYMKNGDSVNIDEADKFRTIEDAKRELKDYDEDFSGAIYKVIEYKSINNRQK